MNTGIAKPDQLLTPCRARQSNLLALLKLWLNPLLIVPVEARS